MIFGTYPCCDAPLKLGLPKGKNKLPAYFREECPKCKTPVWHKLSRWDPESWIEEDFLKEFEVDPETKQVSPKAGR